MKKIYLLSLLIIGITSYGQKNLLENYITDTLVINGDTIIEVTVPGSPPPEKLMPIATPTRSAVMLVNCPAFNWCYGCSATAGAMIAGYYDRNYHPDMYTGSANGGVVPLDNSIWGYGECPLSATHLGYDGLAVKGHVDDFWVSAGSTAPDPYITGGWTPHIHEDCTADFMCTNQSQFNNDDGATSFYWDPYGNPLIDFQAPSGNFDGCAGFKDFIQSRGYDFYYNFTQLIPYAYGNTWGFTFDQYKAQIDAGWPVMIHITGHTMVGVGYDNANQTVYIHDTWDHNLHEMTWGGSYAGGSQWGVSCFMLDKPWGGMPEITFDTDSLYDFIETGQTKTQTVTITNTGSDDLDYLITYEDINLFRDYDLPVKPNTVQSQTPTKVNPTNRYVYRNVLLFRDQLAWGTNVNLPLLESYSGVEVTVAGSPEMGSIDLNAFDVIIFESDQPQAFYNSYIDNLYRFEAYLGSGGIIDFHCATSTEERIPNLPFPGGLLTEDNEELSDYNFTHPSAPPHPILNGIPGTLIGEHVSHEAFKTESHPLGFHTHVYQNYNGYSNTTLGTYYYGAGRLIVSGMTLEQGYANGWNSANLLPNTIGYALGIWPRFFWLTASPLSGTLSPNTSVDIEFTFDATDLPGDFYEAKILIQSNDPEEPVVEIPVSLKVVEGITPPTNLTAELDRTSGEVELSWELLDYDGFYEDFEDDTAQNFIFTDDRFSVADGKLQMNSTGNDIWASAYYDKVYSDKFILEFEFTRHESEATLSHSIGAFVYSDGHFSTGICNGYLFTFTSSGYYSVWYKINGGLYTLIPWTTTSAINTGLEVSNYVTIISYERDFEIYINGQFIDDFFDPTFTSG